MNSIECVVTRLERLPNPDECWLHCDYCARFFQYKDALPGMSPRDRCPFPDCSGDGLGFGLFMWDDMREAKDPRWPASTNELRHGMRSPEMEPFYADQLQMRTTRLLSAFSQSAERLTLEQPPMYLPAFLKLASDLCWDLTEEEPECGFASAELALSIIDQLPVWSNTKALEQAPRMTAELKALFSFAKRTETIEDAGDWLHVLETEDIDALLRCTMLEDPRLNRTVTQPSCRSVRKHKSVRKPAGSRSRNVARRQRKKRFDH